MEPEDKQLKYFGFILFAVIGFWLLVFYYHSEYTLLDLWPCLLILAMLLFLALFTPLRLKIFYLLWMKIAEWINRVVIMLLLTLIFFLLITPVAIIKRNLGNDVLRNPRYIKGTFRQSSNSIKPEDMENPF